MLLTTTHCNDGTFNQGCLVETQHWIILSAWSLGSYGSCPDFHGEVIAKFFPFLNNNFGPSTFSSSTDSSKYPSKQDVFTLRDCFRLTKMCCIAINKVHTDISKYFVQYLRWRSMAHATVHPSTASVAYKSQSLLGDALTSWTRWVFLKPSPIIKNIFPTSPLRTLLRSR